MPKSLQRHHFPELDMATRRQTIQIYTTRKICAVELHFNRMEQIESRREKSEA
jgi:hypothetical protein